jgi:CoA:oxalate CoA-transferase
VYCSISGYGQSGPSRDEAAMDLVVQASSGLLSITGTTDGESARCGYGVTDVTAGLFAVIGILLALRARETTGIGQYIDVSMLDCMISTMTSNYLSYLGSGVVPRPMGTEFPTIVPYRVYRTADGAIGIAVGSEKLWAAFCGAIGRPDLERHPGYETNPARIRNRGALEPILEGVFRERSTADWTARLQQAGVPASPVRNFEDVVNHPQAAVRNMFPTIGHPTAGPYRVTGTPVKLSKTPGAPGDPAPLLGEHSSEAVAELLGMEAHHVAELLRRGILFQTER